jgi:Ca2+:H+ antiporter
VLGLCFIAGGLKHGVQQLDSERARSSVVLMVLAVAALVLPSLASYVHTPAAGHEKSLSLIVSIVLLVLFALYLPASLRQQRKPDTATGSGASTTGRAEPIEQEPPRWPLWVALGMLVLAAAAAAFVSDWFVTALEPAMDALNISSAFAGLVVVAIAGNAVENVVGIQLARSGRSEYAFSVVINSPLQIALVLAPLLVVLSQIFGIASLTLVFSPMLVVSVVLAVVLAAFITFDGESTWLEGAALVAVYCIIAASFWWG